MLGRRKEDKKQENCSGKGGLGWWMVGESSLVCLEGTGNYGGKWPLPTLEYCIYFLFFLIVENLPFSGLWMFSQFRNFST